MSKPETLVQLFSDESRWTKYTGARNECGTEVGPVDEKAVCWCLIGGTMKIYPPDQQTEIWAKMYEALAKKGEDSIGRFNDHSTWKQVYDFVKELGI